MATIWAAEALTEAGWARGVAVEIGPEGRILTVAEAPEPKGAHRADVLLPAPGNLHCHAFQRAMAGLAERRGPEADSFWTWRDLMYRFVERLTPEDVEAIAAQVQVETLEAGFASVGEFHYLHHGAGGARYDAPAEMAARIAAAAAETGIGLTLLPVLYMQGGADRRPLGPGQLRFGCDLSLYGRLLDGAAAAIRGLGPDAGLGVAPHSLRAVPPEALAEAQDMRADDPIHMHIAEQTAEVDEVETALGARPVAWALANLDLAPRWCLVHATQMTAAETEGLARSGAVAGLCPITEANLGDGIFEAARYAAAGGAWGVGSDSNLRVSLAEELRSLEHSQRLRDRRRAVLASPERSSGRFLLEAAARGGARALGRGEGVIAPGQWADLLALEGGDLALDGLSGDTRLDAWIFAATRPAVADLWAAGRHVVQNGRHVAAEGVERRFRAALARLRATL